MFLSEFLKLFSYDPKDLVVIHDDVNLAENRVKVSSKNNSNPSGHNGLYSINESIAQQEKGFGYYQIRVGIDRPTKESGIWIGDWVLQKISSENQQILRESIATKTIEALPFVFQKDNSKAGNIFQ